MSGRLFNMRALGALRLVAGVALLIIGLLLGILGVLGLIVGARNIEYVLGLSVLLIVGGSRLLVSGGITVISGRE